MHRGASAISCAIATLLWSAPAHAQSEIVGPEAFDAAVDLRASVVAGETGWLDGGFGKLREGGDAGSTQPRLRVASVDLVWKPRFSFSLSGLVNVTYQDGQSSDVDVSQAYLKFRTGPSKTRLDVRAGVMWPPVSLEHGASNWRVLDTITPSAANSWIGEEVQVLAFEGTVEQRFGEHDLALTAAVFRQNDMSGTLLTNRGWALHDLRTTVHSDMPLPPLAPSVAAVQDTITTPWLELDKRVGYYAKLNWQPPAPVSVNLFRYDNRGDRVTSRNMQTSWLTRFWNLGALATIDDKTTLKSQYMWGDTRVGPDLPIGVPVYIDFETAYLMLSRDVGEGKLSVRADWFRTVDEGFAFGGNGGEKGWSGMLAYKVPISSHAEALGEILHVSSDREGRRLYGRLPATREQTMVQASLRFGF